LFDSQKIDAAGTVCRINRHADRLIVEADGKRLRVDMEESTSASTRRGAGEDAGRG
jgi:hypothetical protein